MQHAYSWCNTRIHLVLEDDIAATYNRAFDKYLKAKKEFPNAEISGDILTFDFTEEEMDAWSGIRKIINDIIELNHGRIDIQGLEMSSNYMTRVYEDDR